MDENAIHQLIHEIDGYKVMLDFDLAELYGVSTKALNQAMKRNLDRFPPDFSFQLTKEQWDFLRSQIVIVEKKESESSENQQNLRSQFVTSSSKWGGARYMPYAFTEHGVTMLASILKSERAVKMNIAIVRAFIAMRKISMHYNELAEKIKELEIRYNKQFSDIYDVLLAMQEDKKTLDDFANRERIGFKLK
jgi:phage regulator Rha-like protein